MIEGEKGEERERERERETGRETGRERERKNKLMWWNSYSSIFKKCGDSGGPGGRQYIRS
jgi:hypothetical protein